MASSPSLNNLSDVKKRQRDRRSQQALRDRHKNHVQDLEQKLSVCKKDHKPDTIRNLTAEIDSLRRENEILKAQQNQIRSLVSTWAPRCDSLSTPMSGTVVDNTGQNTGELYSPAPRSPSERNGPDQQSHPQSHLSSHHTEIADNLEDKVLPSTAELFDFPFLDLFDLDNAQHPEPDGEIAQSQPFLEPLIPPVYPWNIIPLSHSFQASLEAKPRSLDWLSYPEIIASCPQVPAALDLLYQTRQNFLANAIAQRSRKRVADIERLGFGLLVYVYCKWVISPSPETFSHIPKFLWPVESQLRIPHSNALDLVIWPSLRMSIIEKMSHLNMEPALEMLSRCIKMRWDTAEDPLEPGPDGTLIFRRKFLDALMSMGGWTISKEFVDLYPDLAQGLPPEAISSSESG